MARRPVNPPRPRGTPAPAGTPLPHMSLNVYQFRPNPISLDSDPTKVVFVTKPALLKMIMTAQLTAVKQINDDITRRRTNTLATFRAGTISYEEYSKGIQDLAREQTALLNQQYAQYKEAYNAYRYAQTVRGKVTLRNAIDTPTGMGGYLNTGYTWALKR